MNSLDIFILSLVKRGINTPYSFRSHAGLSLGASLPALRRLLTRRLIRELPQGARGRREFQLTSSGEQELAGIRRHLEVALIEPPADMESVLRLACCAVAAGEGQVANRLLENSAEELERRSAKLKTSLPDVVAENDLPALYLAVTSQCAAEALKANVLSLRDLAARFGSRRPGRRKKSSR